MFSPTGFIEDWQHAVDFLKIVYPKHFDELYAVFYDDVHHQFGYYRLENDYLLNLLERIPPQWNKQVREFLWSSLLKFVAQRRRRGDY